LFHETPFLEDARLPCLLQNLLMAKRVEEILDSRMFQWKLQYLVKWEGYRIENNSWKYLENLDNAVEVVADFNARHPGAPCCICTMTFGTIPFHPISLAFTSS